MIATLLAKSGPLNGLLLTLDDEQEWILGRSPASCDLVLDDTTVSRKQAKIYKEGEKYFLKNISKVNPSILNDEEIDEPVVLKEGDMLQFGDNVFVFSLTTEEKKGAKKPKKKKSSYDEIFDELNVPGEEPPPPLPEKTLEETIFARKQETEPSSEESFYDTIFEEPSLEEQTPFDLSSDSPYLLKVLSGPNAGAEISLDKGQTYIVGKDADTSDILFQDLSVSAKHAKISIADDGTLEIEDLGSKNGTTVNGHVIHEKYILNSQDMVSVGTTLFMIIDREGTQDTIIAEIPSIKKEEEQKKTQAEAVEKRKEDWKSEPIPYKYLIVAGSIAAIFLIAFVSFFSLFKSKGVEIVQKEPVSEIHEALEAKKFSDVEFSFNPASGKLFLVGHVLTSVDYQEMRYNLSTIPFITSIDDTVIIDEGVSKMMNDVLSSHDEWKGINVRAIKPGKFLATGYLQTSSEMAEVNEYFTQNFPYIDQLDNQIAVEQVLNAQITSLLVSEGFSAVNFRLTNGDILFSGVFDRNKEDAFKALIKSVQKMNAISSVKNFAIPTSPELAAIDLTSSFAVGGVSFHDGKGMNVVLNGKIYALGDLVDGMGITEIEQNTILLEKDGVKYRIDYKGY